jgi:hypothetical protein
MSEPREPFVDSEWFNPNHHKITRHKSVGE